MNLATWNAIGWALFGLAIIALAVLFAVLHRKMMDDKIDPEPMVGILLAVAIAILAWCGSWNLIYDGVWRNK